MNKTREKTPMNKRRIEIIDIAKAITIFVVILGHTTSNTDASMFRRIIYSFHMPLFFILAGLSIKPRILSTGREWLEFLKKSILAVVVPYLIWGMFYGTFAYKSFGYLFTGSWEALNEMGTLTSLWYLTCYFVAKIIVQLVINLILKFSESKRKLLFLIAGVIVTACGYLIVHPESGVIWCADIAVVAAGFILLGIAIKEIYITMAQQKNLVIFLIFAVSTGLFFLCTLGRGDNLHLSIMAKADYGNVLWFSLSALLGSIAVLSLSWVIFRLSRESRFQFSTRAITFIGSHTLGIFILHKPFLWEVAVPFFSNLMSGCPFELIALVSSIVALIYSIIVCVIIEKFVPQLLGQFN